MADVLKLVRQAAQKKILFLPHAVSQMSHPDRMISTMEVREVVMGGQVVEDYPSDPRGQSCLLGGDTSENRHIPVVCSPKEDYLAIVTAYVPSEEDWERGFRRRRKP